MKIFYPIDNFLRLEQLTFRGVWEQKKDVNIQKSLKKRLWKRLQPSLQTQVSRATTEIKSMLDGLLAYQVQIPYSILGEWIESDATALMLFLATIVTYGAVVAGRSMDKSC